MSAAEVALPRGPQSAPPALALDAPAQHTNAEKQQKDANPPLITAASAQRSRPSGQQTIVTPLSRIKVSSYIRATAARYRAWKSSCRGLAQLHHKDEQDRIAQCIVRQGRSQTQLWDLRIPIDLLVNAMSYLPPPALGDARQGRAEPLAVERLMLASTLTLALVLENRSVMQPAQEGIARRQLAFGNFRTSGPDADDDSDGEWQ